MKAAFNFWLKTICEPNSSKWPSTVVIFCFQTLCKDNDLNNNPTHLLASWRAPFSLSQVSVFFFHKLQQIVSWGLNRFSYPINILLRLILQIIITTQIGLSMIFCLDAWRILWLNVQVLFSTFSQTKLQLIYQTCWLFVFYITPATALYIFVSKLLKNFLCVSVGQCFDSINLSKYS